MSDDVPLITSLEIGSNIKILENGTGSPLEELLIKPDILNEKRRFINEKKSNKYLNRINFNLKVKH